MTKSDQTAQELDELIARCTVIERDDNENSEKVIDVEKLTAALRQLMLREFLALIGGIPDEADLWRYNGELRGCYDERLRLRQAATQRFGQVPEGGHDANIQE